MTRVKVADYVCVRDIEITLDPREALEFDVPANAVNDHFYRSPILMFLVRADANTGERLKLRVELNGDNQFEREIVADTAARSYHEIINREDLEPGDENRLRFSDVTDVSLSATARIIISDVVVWFQQTAET